MYQARREHVPSPFLQQCALAPLATLDALAFPSDLLTFADRRDDTLPFLSETAAALPSHLLQ